MQNIIPNIDYYRQAQSYTRKRDSVQKVKLFCINSIPYAF
jgi:hypothetical protein